jgi:hypothetical protein
VLHVRLIEEERRILEDPLGQLSDADQSDIRKDVPETYF